MALSYTCHVSIPERVWGGLELPLIVFSRAESFVSIPERVWGGLEPRSTSPCSGGTITFQSLRGFGVGWSPELYANLGLGESVSIPERVWGGLERRRSSVGPMRKFSFNP